MSCFLRKSDAYKSGFDNYSDLPDACTEFGSISNPANVPLWSLMASSIVDGLGASLSISSS